MSVMTSKELTYLGIGIGIGSAAAMLFAPQSGPETRQLLKNKVDEGADYAKRRSEELRNSAAQAIDRGKDAIDRGKEKLRHQQQNLSAAIDAGKQAYRESVETTPE
jgi:gas vesicle protein